MEERRNIHHKYDLLNYVHSCLFPGHTLLFDTDAAIGFSLNVVVWLFFYLHSSCNVGLKSILRNDCRKFRLYRKAQRGDKNVYYHCNFFCVCVCLSFLFLFIYRASVFFFCFVLLKKFHFFFTKKISFHMSLLMDHIQHTI